MTYLKVKKKLAIHLLTFNLQKNLQNKYTF